MPIRDSLSRYDPYQQNLYVHTDPACPHPPLSEQRIREIQRDAILRIQDEWTEEEKKGVLEQWMKGSSRLILIAKGGRWILVALLLPPSLVLVIIPKWIFLHAIPLGWGWLSAGTSRWLASCASLMQALAERAQGGGRACMRIIQKWTAQYVRIQQTILQAVQRGGASIYREGKKMALWVQHVAQKAVSPLKLPWNILRRWLKNRPALPKLSIAERWKEVQEGIRVFWRAKIAQPVLLAGTFFRNQGERIIRLFEKAWMQIAQPFASFSHQIRHRGRRAFQQCRSAMQSLIRPIARGWRRIADPLKEKWERARAKIGEMAQEAARWTQSIVPNMQQVIAPFAFWMINPFRKISEKFSAGKNALFGSFKKLKHRIRSWVTGVQSTLRSISTSVFSWILTVGKRLGQLLYGIYLRIMVLMRVLAQFCLALLRKLGSALMSVWKGLRAALFFVAGAILLSWKMAREFLHTLEERF